MRESLKTGGTFGSRLAAARNAVPLTQEKLAEIMGVSKPQISRYESDKDLPGHDKVPALERAVGKSMAYLLTGDDSIGGKVIDPELYALLAKMDKLPPPLQEFVKGAIRLAEETKGAIPTQFLTPPTQENGAEFHAYLAQIAEQLRKK